MSRRTSDPTGTAFVITHESDPNRQSKSLSLIALAVTRSLGRNGVRVVRVHPNHLDHGLTSKYCTEIAVSPDMYASATALVDYLLMLASKYDGKRVLIPASDDCAQFLGEHRSALARAYELCVADSNVIELVVNKRNQYEHAARLGVPIPETYFPKDSAAIEKLAGQIRNFPYVLKPLVAHTWRLASMRQVSKGRKAVLVRTPDELRGAYAALGEGGKDVMVQEVIGGRDEQLFTFLGYFAKGSKPLAYCVRRKIRQLPLDFGYCTMTVSCHDDKVVEQSIRLLQGIGYTGIVGVEYKYDAATGQYKLIEINARPVNTIGLAPACGVDIPYIAYRDLSGEAVDPVTTWRDEVTWYRIWFDFLAVRELRRKGGGNYWEWWKSLWGDHTEAVFAADDLKPAWSHFSEVLLTELSTQARKRTAWWRRR
jgi:predicted ATP-grasp superfamily ATP-dependent carboligase